MSSKYVNLNKYVELVNDVLDTISLEKISITLWQNLVI